MFLRHKPVHRSLLDAIGPCPWDLVAAAALAGRHVGHRPDRRHRHDQWLLAPSLVAHGFGMGACFGSIYQIAACDVAESGSLSAIQHSPAAIGSATVTTAYLTHLGHGGQAHAMAISVAIVAIIAAAWPLPALLLPRQTNPAPREV